MMSIYDKQLALVEDLQALPDWMERYRYIIAMGEAMLPMPEAYKTPKYRVLGCASKTFFAVDRTNGIITIHADSNSPIPLGLAALLHHIYSGNTVQEAQDSTLFFHEKSGLKANLTGNRLMGFLEMVLRISSLK